MKTGFSVGGFHDKTKFNTNPAQSQSHNKDRSSSHTLTELRGDNTVDMEILKLLQTHCMHVSTNCSNYW